MCMWACHMCEFCFVFLSRLSCLSRANVSYTSPTFNLPVCTTFMQTFWSCHLINLFFTLIRHPHPTPAFLDLGALEWPILLSFVAFASILLKLANLWEAPGHTSDTRENTNHPPPVSEWKQGTLSILPSCSACATHFFFFCKKILLAELTLLLLPCYLDYYVFVSNTQGTRGSQKTIFQKLILFLPWIEELDWGGQAFTASAVPLSRLADPVDTLVLKIFT